MRAQSSSALDLPSGWIGADALARASVPGPLRGWLTYPGLLSARMRELFGELYALHVVREQHLQGCNEALSRMACAAGPALLREIEIVNGRERAMFAQTCIPLPTLQAHPWLGALGTSSLGETLVRVTSVHRGVLEFRALTACDSLFAAADPHAPRSASLWARRSVFAIEGAPLLVTEVFLPELERWQPC